MNDSTKPLRRVTIMENNCQGPIFIGVAPIWMIVQNHFVDRHNHYVPTLTPTGSQYRKTTVPRVSSSENITANQHNYILVQKTSVMK